MRYTKKKECFVTIQNNILLKQPAATSLYLCGFVTIQNNILLKPVEGELYGLTSFVTIQNNILLKPQSFSGASTTPVF